MPLPMSQRRSRCVALHPCFQARSGVPVSSFIEILKDWVLTLDSKSEELSCAGHLCVLWSSYSVLWFSVIPLLVHSPRRTSWDCYCTFLETRCSLSLTNIIPLKQALICPNSNKWNMVIIMLVTENKNCNYKQLLEQVTVKDMIRIEMFVYTATKISYLCCITTILYYSCVCTICGSGLPLLLPRSD